MIAHDERIRQRFPDWVLWVTIGESAGSADLATTLNELAGRVSGVRPSFTDPEQASYHLGALLEGKRCLLIVDDVWRASQLEPFCVGSMSCHRLVTTRMHDILPVRTPRVTVDAMPSEQALTVLSEGLEKTGAREWETLVARTGGWPVLLYLVNRAVHRYARRGVPVAEAANRVAGQLAAKGPTALDVANPDQRRLAVTATIDVSLSLLAADDTSRLERFLELAVFVESSVIPRRALEAYWGQTADLDPDEVEELCLDLADLSLVQEYQAGYRPHLRLHDVMREYLRHRVGPHVIKHHQTLIDSYRKQLPTVNESTAWWDLPDVEPYLWPALGHHLHHASLTVELEAVVSDFRWMTAVLRYAGPEAVARNLHYGTTVCAEVLRQVIRQSAHLFASIEADNSQASTLLSRLYGYPELADYITTAESTLPLPYLVPVQTLPDVGHPALQRVLAGSRGPVSISSDGRWLATGSDDGTVRLWTTTGTESAALIGNSENSEWPRAVAIGPDGRWLATGSDDGTVRLWTTTGKQFAVLSGHRGPVTDVAISPDVSGRNWLVTAGWDKTVRLWKPDGTELLRLTRHRGGVNAVAISPDGSWFATAGDDRAIRMWRADGKEVGILTDPADVVVELAIHQDGEGAWLAAASYNRTTLWNVNEIFNVTTTIGPGPITEVAISPDGTWIATTSDSDTIRFWDADGRELEHIPGRAHMIRGIAISPDCRWLITGSLEGGVLWDSEGNKLSGLPSNAGRVTDVAISPDGTWLAMASDNETVRLWKADGSDFVSLSGHAGTVTAVAISPCGAWVATASTDSTVRLWKADGSDFPPLAGHTDVVTDVAISPDSAWLATTSWDQTVRLWGMSTRQCESVLKVDSSLRHVEWFPEGDQIVAAGISGLYLLRVETGSVKMR